MSKEIWVLVRKQGQLEMWLETTQRNLFGSRHAINTSDKCYLHDFLSKTATLGLRA